MSHLLDDLNRNNKPKPLTDRIKILALAPDPVYDDGRTKQSHKDETDIVKIMARFDRTGTISHITKHEASYADFSDFDYREQLSKLTRGREIFDELPAEVRREFNQNPAAFFEFVNDPDNVDDLLNKLPALAEPGDQNPKRHGEPDPPEPPAPPDPPAPPEPPVVPA